MTRWQRYFGEIRDERSVSFAMTRLMCSIGFRVAKAKALIRYFWRNAEVDRLDSFAEGSAGPAGAACVPHQYHTPAGGAVFKGGKSRC